MVRFNEEILDSIRDRVDIVRLIGEYVPLKRAGRAFKGLCPFHKEKTPSFFVNPDRQIFKCFGCGESGNVFSFLMKYEGISFQQAVERLAAQAGIVLPEKPLITDKNKHEIKIFYKLISEALKIYEHYLNDVVYGKKARNYLLKRGFDQSFWGKMHLGYATESWDNLLNSLLKKGFKPLELEKVGLIVRRSDNSGFYDRFRNRIIFPIREHRKGRVVAFGGRTLGEDPAKYINSPETPIYKKNSILYGYWESIQAIRRERTAIVVEGYFDRLSLLKVGFENVVAPCGTALTSQQVKLLKRAALKIIFLFDADSAGISAARRAMELCLSQGIETIAAPLPSGMDPDDIVREDGKKAIEDILDKGQSALDFLLYHLKNNHDISTSKGRRNIVEELLPFLFSVDNSIDRGIYISRIANLIQVPDQSILELMKRRKRRMNKDKKINHIILRKGTNIDPRERDLIVFLLDYPSHIADAEEKIKDDYFITKCGLQIFQILKSYKNYKEIPISKILDEITSSEVKDTLVDIVMDPERINKLINCEPAELLSALALDFMKNFIKKKLLKNKLLIDEREKKGLDNSDLLKERMILMKELSNLN